MKKIYVILLTLVFLCGCEITLGSTNDNSNTTNHITTSYTTKTPINNTTKPKLEYYNSITNQTGQDLVVALYNIISNNRVLSYNDCWDAISYTDEDPNNSNNVLLIYTGRSQAKTTKASGTDSSKQSYWNREHVWPQSAFASASNAKTDLHHLRASDVSVNSTRGNKMFDECSGSYIFDSTTCDNLDSNLNTYCRTDSVAFEPRDEVKGDIARMLFYMAVRYYNVLELVNNPVAANGETGCLDTLLKWHNSDPVDAYEERRNERIYEIQGNRNPFIDNPSYVNLIWK